MGLPQFMPGSINRFAVDFDGDGHVDLSGQRRRRDRQRRPLPARCTAGSRGLAHAPTPSPPPVDTADRALLLAPDIVPELQRRTQFAAARRRARRRRPPRTTGTLALVELQNGDAGAELRGRHAELLRRSRATTSRATTRWRCIALGDAVAAARDERGRQRRPVEHRGQVSQDLTRLRPET
ncbi:MAG: lytic murein transglycosylase [Comamonadaceae bacterium]|nr:lytic murein transglycosylase [Comamonadaceae bacterium]